jgi:hypothetical protein
LPQLLSFLTSSTQLWSPSNAALTGPNQKLSNIKTPPFGKNLATSAKKFGNKVTTTPATTSTTTLRNITSPQTVMKVTATLMLIFGVGGLASPEIFHTQMVGLSKASLTGEASFYIFFTALRESVMAIWLILAATYSSTQTCKVLLGTMLALMIPTQIYKLHVSKSLLLASAYTTGVLTQTILGLYMAVSFLWNK